VFSAVAMAIGNMSDRIEIYKTDTGNARILVNGIEYDMNSPSSSELKGKSWHTYEAQYLYYITERLSDCCLMPTQQFFSYIIAKTS